MDVEEILGTLWRFEQVADVRILTRRLQAGG